MSTKIAWTEETWNPVVGCTKVSPGCDNCYAERMALRIAGIESAALEKQMNHLAHPAIPLVKNRIIKYMLVVNVRTKSWSGKITCDVKSLEIPLHWKNPRQIFVCSMGDLFHESVPFEFIDKVMAVIWELECRRVGHTF